MKLTGLSIAKNISSNLKEDYIDLLKDQNYFHIFQPLFELHLKQVQLNTLICAIIYSYDQNSNWINFNKDGYEINREILTGLGANFKEEIYNHFIELSNPQINEAVGSYLNSMIDWRFTTAREFMDYHAKYVRVKEEDMTGMDEDKKMKTRENIGKLKTEAMSKRKASDELIELIKKDFVNTDYRVKQETGLSFTDETIKRDTLSWRQFIAYDLIELKKKNHLYQKFNHINQ